MKIGHINFFWPLPSVHEDLEEITEYLIDLKKLDVYYLGLKLGLYHRKLIAMQDSPTFLSDVIHAWLQKEDCVEKKGEPSWTTLVKALKHRRVGQTGVANQIIKDKGLKLHGCEFCN